MAAELGLPYFETSAATGEGKNKNKKEENRINKILKVWRMQSMVFSISELY